MCVGGCQHFAAVATRLDAFPYTHTMEPWYAAKRFDSSLSCCITGSTGYTPLHYAARAGQAKCVEVLLRHGACVSMCVATCLPAAAAAAAPSRHALIMAWCYGAPQDLHLRACRHSREGYTLTIFWWCSCCSCRCVPPPSSSLLLHLETWCCRCCC